MCLYGKKVLCRDRFFNCVKFEGCKLKELIIRSKIEFCFVRLTEN